MKILGTFIILLRLNIFLSTIYYEDNCKNINNPFITCFYSECNLFDDRCIDKLEPIISQYPYNSYECNAKLNTVEYMYTLGKCPKTFSNEKIKNNCENENPILLNSIPVYSNKTGNFYKNIYCFLCISPNEKIEYTKLFNIIIPHSKNLMDPQNLILNGSFSLAIKNEIPNPIECFKNINQCPEKKQNQSIINLCKNYTAYTHFLGGKVCSVCNVSNDQFNKDMLNGFNMRDGIQILFDLNNLGQDIQININATYRNNLIFSSSNTTVKVNENKSEIKIYITLIGHLLSIMSLWILIIFCVIRKNFKNMSGLILINLSLSLLLSQAFFITSIFITQYEKNSFEFHFDFLNNLLLRIKLILPCYLISLLTHYFYLAFFLWSNIMAIDLYQMFTKSNLLVKIKLKKKFLILFYLYGWLGPVSIVMTMIFKNFNKLSYGYRKCFISNQMDLFLFFILPVALVILVNFVLVLLSIRLVIGIDKLKDEFVKTENENILNRFVLFVKLFVITGLTWILGIVSSLTNDQDSFLWYPYIVFNSLQGFFLMCSYLFKLNKLSFLKKNTNQYNNR
ncbi:unnamed protein product [Brachionus calyciflorus]|uniref:G-protein coupled receptors family 2 profile 2 domain-containing protein n=1 Tax=Brachionus calyciflorus TaxID=104777 RepID=A0A813M4Z3_9BILA|nr:unnamed protein product [Brachionus calyciflorus]